MCGVPDRSGRRLSAAPDRPRPSGRGLRADRGSRRRRRSAAPNPSSAATWCASSPRARSPRSACSSRAAPITCSPSPAAASPRRNGCYGLAAVDISTGHFALSETDGTGLSAEIARFEPREILLPDVIHDDPDLSSFWQETRASITPLPREGARSGLGRAAAERAISGSRPSMPSAPSRAAEISAAGGALFYIEKTQIDSRPVAQPAAPATPPARRLPSMRRPAPIWNSPGPCPASAAGSLLATIDCTVTPGGARLLAERLAGPLTHPDVIRDRHDSVAASSRTAILRDSSGASSSALPIWRARLSRLALAAAARAISPACATACLPRASWRALLIAAICRGTLGGRGVPAGSAHGCRRHARAALADELPLLKRDGGFMRADLRRNLDELRELQQDSRRFIAALQARYATETGCRTLRVKHNHMIGYYVEVPQNVGEDLLKEPWKETFVHRQTMAGAMRFSTVELGELESKIASASDRALRIELGLFDAMAQDLIALSADDRRWRRSHRRVDVSAALAELAVQLDWVRPVIDNGLAFRIRAGAIRSWRRR